jgi:hypothetical protein
MEDSLPLVQGASIQNHESAPHYDGLPSGWIRKNRYLHGGLSRLEGPWI